MFLTVLPKLRKITNFHIQDHKIYVNLYLFSKGEKDFILIGFQQRPVYRVRHGKVYILELRF